MTSQYLKDPNGRVLGVIRPAGDGSLRIYTLDEKLRGTYYTHNNTTFHPNGSVVGNGNLLVTLIQHSGHTKEIAQ